MAQCSFIKPDGSRCRAHALKDQELCRYHAQPDAAKEEGRRGGQAARQKAVLAEADFSLKTPQEVAAMLEHVTNTMLKGELDRALASTAGYLAATLLKALEGDLAGRVAALEKAFKERGRR